MTDNTLQFDARDFCSRKLWQWVADDEHSLEDDDLAQAVAELARRRRYLEELQKIGKL